MKALKNVLIFLLYLAMLSAVLIYFSGNGVFIYEGV